MRSDNCCIHGIPFQHECPRCESERQARSPESDPAKVEPAPHLIARANSATLTMQCPHGIPAMYTCLKCIEETGGCSARKNEPRVKQEREKRTGREPKMPEIPEGLRGEAERLLICWGDFEANVDRDASHPLTELRRLSGESIPGRGPRIPDESAAVELVQTTSGFRSCHPALEHLYVFRLPPRKFDADEALKGKNSLQWSKLLATSEPGRACVWVALLFTRNLALRISRDHPYEAAQVEDERKGPLTFRERMQEQYLRREAKAVARGDLATAARLREKRASFLRETSTN